MHPCSTVFNLMQKILPTCFQVKIIIFLIKQLPVELMELLRRIDSKTYRALRD